MGSTDTDNRILHRSASDSQIERVYSRFSWVYGRTVEHLTARGRNQAIEWLHLNGGEHLCDVGCGAGGGILEMAEQVGDSGQVVGIDIAPGMVSETRRRIRSSAHEQITEVICGDARLLPFSAEAFDGVLLADVLELFQSSEIPTVLCEISRVLTIDGRLSVVSLDKSGESPSPAVRGYELAYRYLPGFSVFGCRPINVDNSLTAAGFDIIAKTTITMGVKWPVTVTTAQVGRK